MFLCKKSLNKIESSHKGALRFRLNDCENSIEQLLEKSGKSNMIEKNKTTNSLNRDFMKKIHEISFKKSYDPQIWNILPFNTKTTENLSAFKNLMKKWNGASCNCIKCSQ